MVYGPAQLYKSDTTSCTLLKAFAIESYDFLTDEYYIVVKNGNRSGEGRVDDTKITINGEEVFSPVDFANNVGSLVKKVTLQKNVELIAEINDKYSELITIWIIGVHGGPGSPFLPEQAYPGQSGEMVKYNFNGSTITCELINGEIIFQGDIILTEEQVSSSGAKGASDSGIKKWKDNTVYYHIRESCPFQKQIVDAISEIESKTSLKFEHRGLRTNYIFFREANGNEGMSSKIGMLGIPQSITVPTSWNGNVTGSIIHEICHAVGMIHEHSRSDRDLSVTIHEENIRTDVDMINFDIVNNSLNTSTLDFGSVMMYHPLSGSKNNKETITKKDGSTYKDKYQRDGLATGDIEMLNT